jgi:putative flippase GtrA
MLAMSDLERRGSYTPRRSREQRAYRLAVVGGIAGAVGVVGFALAIFGVIGSGLPILALIIAAVCAFLVRRSVSS